MVCLRSIYDLFSTTYTERVRNGTGIPATRNIEDRGVTHLVLAQAPPKSTDKSTQRALFQASEKQIPICSWTFVHILQKVADPPNDRPPAPPRTTSTDDEKARRLQRLDYHAGTDERWWGMALLEKDWDANWPVERAYVPEGVAALIDVDHEAGGEDDDDNVMIIQEDGDGGEPKGRPQDREIVDLDTPKPLVEDSREDGVFPPTATKAGQAPPQPILSSVPGVMSIGKHAAVAGTDQSSGKGTDFSVFVEESHLLTGSYARIFAE
jgi:hypothetical protein